MDSRNIPQNEPLYAIADAIDKLAVAVDRLGMNYWGSSPGAVEGHAMIIKEAVSNSVEILAAAIMELKK
jgi:hypothetical protein